MGLVDAKRAMKHLEFCSPAELYKVKRYIEERLGAKSLDGVRAIPFDVYVWKMRVTVPGIVVTEVGRTRFGAWCRAMVIYKMLCDGYSVGYVAQCFGMSAGGVKYARSNIDKMLENPRFYPDEYRIYCLYISNFAEYEKDLGKD